MKCEGIPLEFGLECYELPAEICLEQKARAPPPIGIHFIAMHTVLQSIQ
jgi:hypothetical protein